MKSIAKFVREEDGTETVEWGVMAGLIVVGLVVIVVGIGTWVSGKLGQLQVELETNAPVPAVPPPAG